MKTKQYRLLILALIGILIDSCQKYDVQVDERQQIEELPDLFADIPRL